MNFPTYNNIKTKILLSQNMSKSICLKPKQEENMYTMNNDNNKNRLQSHQPGIPISQQDATHHRSNHHTSH